MSWVIDTCVILDVLEDDPDFGRASALLLERHLPEGLSVCPVTQVELAPAFAGDLTHQRRFFQQAGIDDRCGWSLADTELAHAAWHRHIVERRSGLQPKRPVADLLIGAFAMNRLGLITRNPKDFRGHFPDLTILEP